MAFRKVKSKFFPSPITAVVEDVYVNKVINVDGEERTVVEVHSLDMGSKDAVDMLPLAEEFDYETQLKTGVVLENVLNPQLLNPSDPAHLSEMTERLVEQSAKSLNDE